jgi:hypothetical protein
MDGDRQHLLGMVLTDDVVIEALDGFASANTSSIELPLSPRLLSSRIEKLATGDRRMCASVCPFEQIHEAVLNVPPEAAGELP